MVYVTVRQTVEDYKIWRPFFDNDAARRRTAGATGVNTIYRDVDNPNTVTVVLEWDNAKNAQKFLNDPALIEIMKKAGVVGVPDHAVQTRL